MSDPTNTTGRAGIVAVVGAANVGKSTLVNALVGEKVSIVSPVVQTTRNIIRAIWTEPRGQLVFMDTTGVHRAQYDLGRLMNRMARSTADGADLVMWVADASRPPREEDEGWLRRLLHREQSVPLLAVLNKIDLDRDHRAAYRALRDTIAAEKAHADVTPWVEVSGHTGQGMDTLGAMLFDHVPPGPPLFPDDILTDYPRKLHIGDVVREKYALRLRDELPHAIAVWIDTLEEKPNGWAAQGTIYVNRHSQKGIVLGAKGKLLKTVTREAEQDLAEQYGHPVRLRLWVKEEKDWARNYWMLQRLGYTE